MMFIILHILTFPLVRQPPSRRALSALFQTILHSLPELVSPAITLFRDKALKLFDAWESAMGEEIRDEIGLGIFESERLKFMFTYCYNRDHTLL